MKFKKEDKVLLISDSGEKYIVDINQTFFTKDGELRLKSLIGKKWGTMIRSNTGKVFWAIPPRFSDVFRKLRKGPQGVLMKDAAIIAAYTGIGPGSKVVDAGTGSGHLAAFLAKIVAPEKLISYEIRKEWIKIAKENFEKLGITNIKIKNKNIYEGISERKLDLITLDLPEPWKIPNLKEALISGGYVVAYLPQMTQVIKFVEFCNRQNLFVEAVIEMIQREWVVSGKVARPTNTGISHTAFLVFARKLNH